MENEKKAVQAEEQSITLTLTPKHDEKEEVKKQFENKENVKDQYDESRLTQAERKLVDDFAKKIDVCESGTILQYGSAAQKKVTDFSDTALKNVETKELGTVGELLTDLVKELRGFDVTDNKNKDRGFFGFFKKAENKIFDVAIKYNTAEKNVEKIARVLEDHQIQLLKDIALLDQLYERNAINTKELSMYILAGKKKLADIRSNDLPLLVKKAQESKLPEDSQAANDLSQACERFEKKLYDLELTRQISIQMAPQIRLIQNNDTLMTEKIQSTLVNTIPLWKNQIVLALGISHSKEAMEAQREVSNMTNKLLQKNAEILHQATVDTAKESERGIVDIETLQHTNQQLIATLDEVLTIQQESHEKRAAAEVELKRIENELHQKLLQVRSDVDTIKE